MQGQMTTGMDDQGQEEEAVNDEGWTEGERQHCGRCIMEDLYDICLPGSAQDLMSGSRSRNPGLRATCPKEASDLMGVGERENKNIRISGVRSSLGCGNIRKETVEPKEVLS